MSGHDDIFYLSLKIILRNKQNQVLILQMHKNGDTFWELPGGRIQQGETEMDPLHPELKEETGITVIENLKHLDTYLSDYRVSAHRITAGFLFSFYVAYVENDKIMLSNDHIDYAWVDKQEALKRLGDAYGPNLFEYLK